MLSRTQEKLEAVASKVRNEYHRETKIVQYDLSKLGNQESVDELYSILDNLNVEVSILVNAAGKAHLNPLHLHSIEMCFFMVNVNVNAMIFLSHYYSKKFATRYETT